MAYSTGVDPGEIVLESTNFDADRPFFYIIHERSTDALLFIGQVTNL
jgi:serine protease inhibitor